MGRRGLTKNQREAEGLELVKIRGARTQKAFAAELGVGVRSLIRYESGEREVPLPALRLARGVVLKSKR
jgi:DNA-binding transcriptional regulator YiaG